MPLAQVRDFVGQHGGQLILGFGPVEQAIVDADHPARHGERIDRGIVDDDQLNSAVLQLGVRDQLVDKVFQVVE